MAQQAQFDFDSYNAMMKTANTGLKLHLGIQLIKDVVSSLEYFDNPLEVELRPVYVELKEFHQMYKAAAKKQAEARTNEKEVSNATLKDLQEKLTLLKEIQALEAQQKVA